jgi:hypothetical protein
MTLLVSMNLGFAWGAGSVPPVVDMRIRSIRIWSERSIGVKSLISESIDIKQVISPSINVKAWVE